MKPKIYAILGLLVFLFSSCNKDENDKDVISQRYVHKYGFDISEKEWDARNQNGQIITVLKNGITKKSSYLGGTLHGAMTLTFPHSNVIQEQCEYNEGKLVKKTIYEINGLPMQEYSFDEEGKRVITVWDKNGVPLSMEEYEDTFLISARYYNTQNEIEANIIDGNGTRIKRDRDGLLLSKEKVENGKIIHRTAYHPNSEIQSETSFLDYQLHGEQKTYSPTGNLLTHVNWDNGKIDGIMTCYRNGQIFIEVPYKKGKRHGIEKEYNLQGALVKEIHWDNNLRHGTSRYYHEDYTDIQWYWKGLAVDLKKFQMLELRESLIAEINGDKESILEKMQKEDLQ